MTLIVLSAAFLGGVLLGSRLDASPWLVLLSLTPLPLLLLRKQPGRIIRVSLCLLAFAAGMVRYPAGPDSDRGNTITAFNDGAPVTLRGAVVTAPEPGPRSSAFTVNSLEILQNQAWQPVAGKVLVYAPAHTPIRNGDLLSISGKLLTPPSFVDFDYRGYLQNRGVYSLVYSPDVRVVAAAHGLRPMAFVQSVRRALADSLARSLPEPQASLAQGLVLGIRAGIPEDVKSDFVRTGTAHVLVISGMHFSLVAGMLTATAVWLFGKRRYLYVWLALAVIWVYAILTGLGTPVVRSAVMLSLFLCADLFGRQRSALPALAFAAMLMVAISPLALWDASFQLSFLATLGLAVVAPPLQALGRRAVSRLGNDGFGTATLNWVADGLAVTLGVMLLIWPLLLHYFGVVSPVGPVATMLLSPALAPVMVLGFLTAVAGLLAPPAGAVAGWLAWPFLSYILTVVRGSALLPGASLVLDAMPPPLTWLYLGVALAALLIYRRRRTTRVVLARVAALLVRVPIRLAATPALALTLIAAAFSLSQPDGRLHVAFLDVGQGDAILIRTPRGHDILVDGGPDTQAVVTALGRSLPFWDRTIELVVLTHPHADHLAGLNEVLRRYRVTAILAPALEGDSPLWDQWQALLEEEGAAITVAQAGQKITAGGTGVTIEVLTAGAETADLDAGGTVLRVNYDRVSFLLTADMPARTELDLALRRQAPVTTVLKVAHHGSDTSTSPEFLGVVQPRVAVISAGAGNRYGHPHREVLERLTEAVGETGVYRTDMLGTIEFTTDGRRLWTSPERRQGGLP